VTAAVAKWERRTVAVKGVSLPDFRRREKPVPRRSPDR